MKSNSSRHRWHVISAAICLLAISAPSSAQNPSSHLGDIGTTFGSVTDTCTFEFALYDSTAGGSQIGPVIERELRVRGGRYEVELDFGPEATDGGSRYLEVAVGCPAGTADLTTLTRRVWVPGATVRSGRAGRATPASENPGAQPKAALGTGFTYQGELNESGSPVTGLGDFEFSLWDALSGGNQIGATVPASAVGVEEGRFTTQLDFGAAAFDGDARWLQIAVDYPSGTGSFTTLSPRQPLSAAPYALQTRGIFVDDINRVGIGTDTPVHPLHVVGSAMVDGDLHIESGHDIEISDPSNRISVDLGGLRLESGDDIMINPSNDLTIDGTTLVVDSDTNRVGIGTLTPDVSLDVAGDIGLASGHWIGIGPSSERINFDGIGNDLEILGANLGLGTTSPDEMLHVENGAASGRAFLKLQTSHPSDWGETGLRFETPQNRWHLRMDDDSNNNLPIGAIGLRCNTPGHEIMTWTEDGTVGIGTTQPSAKLDVVGDVRTSGEVRYSTDRTFTRWIPPFLFHEQWPDDDDQFVADGTSGHFHAGTGSLHADLFAQILLPEGAHIDEIRLYFVDNDPYANLWVYLTVKSIDLLSASIDLMVDTWASTSGSSLDLQSIGVDSMPFATIDNGARFYTIRVVLVQDDLVVPTGVHFRGCRVVYSVSQVSH